METLEVEIVQSNLGLRKLNFAQVSILRIIIPEWSRNSSSSVFEKEPRATQYVEV